jgi:DNA-binding transcriptional MerR regulator
MTSPESEPERGLFGITTAAELVGTGVQSLRLYEARGLVSPSRTTGGTRRYSSDDLVRLRRIGELLDAGLNLAGVAAVLGLECDNAQLRAELDDRPAKPADQDRVEASEPRDTRGLRRGRGL